MERREPPDHKLEAPIDTADLFRYRQQCDERDDLIDSGFAHVESLFKNGEIDKDIYHLSIQKLTKRRKDNELEKERLDARIAGRTVFLHSEPPLE